MTTSSDFSAASTEEVPEAAQTTGQRTRSTITFPYQHLESCVEVARAVHAVGGDACQWNQLAARLNQSPGGGGFRQRMISARTFGLLDYAKQRVQLTDIGRACIDQSREMAGRESAFLHVPLFNDMFGKLDGHPLPPNVAIEQQMVELGVAPKQAGKARQAFHRSATHAGYFEISPDRMTKPSHGGEPSQEEHSDIGERDDERVGGGDPPSGPPVHPLIAALLGQLPPETEGEFEQRRCLIWLQMMLSSLTLIYGDSAEELLEIEVRLRISQNAAA